VAVGHGLGLNRTHALAGHAIDAADLIEGARPAVHAGEPKSHDTRLTLGQRVEHLLELARQHGEPDRVERDDGLPVLK
jgi:hypothetical protein